MTPDESSSARARRRSHHACLNCRRKKTRCPGEKPACSSCARLKQACAYPAAVKPAQNDRSEERLAHLEEKLDLLLSGSLASRGTRRDSTAGESSATPERSFSVTPPASAPSDHQHHQHHQHHQQQQQQQQQQQRQQHHPPPATAASEFGSSGISNLRPGLSDIALGIGLYFKYCHRQPIWCFEREDLGDYAILPEELACSILALTSHFSKNRDQQRLYGDNAKTLIMLLIANGTVELTTLESLCLLSYSSFIDGNFHLGQFHLGLAFQLCRSAMLDLESTYALEDGTTERKKRLFWSLQLLEQHYGRQNGLLSVQTDVWRPFDSASETEQMESRPRAPPLPRDELGTSTPNEPGIWNTSIHLSWVWSQVRKYVSNCANNILREPWHHRSMYAKVLSDFMETENRIPICHRYDSAKFYKRKMEELEVNRDYWAPWLKEQFTYHAIPTVLNHPFLYIVGAQHNPNLAIPNTFWRRSSELALLHATWIVRMIDMVVDRQVPLADPFFGHVAAIAATVHLYYCCAAAPRLKHKSNTDFAKCRRFLKSFIPTSAACEALDRNLERMTRMAAGPESMDVEDWVPSKIYLSVPLMWEILQFNSTEESQDVSTAGLLDASLVPAITQDNASDESTTLEIAVATSPEITINTADGGQEAPSISFKSAVHSSRRDSPWTSSSAAAAAAAASGGGGGGGGGAAGSSSSGSNMRAEKQQADQMDNLAFNFTPWLYADSSQFVNLGDMGGMDGSSQDSNPSAWWESTNYNNIMFNSF